MEPGVVDLNNLSPEEALALLERVQEVVARQQTQDAIVRDVTEVVDPIVRDNREILGDQWVSGRVSWDGQCLTVTAPDPEPDDDRAAEPDQEVVTLPEPVPYELSSTVIAGAAIEWEGRLLRVRRGHERTPEWNPDTKPGWFEEV